VKQIPLDTSIRNSVQLIISGGYSKMSGTTATGLIEKPLQISKKVYA
jgi:hypothetical protein